MNAKLSLLFVIPGLLLASCSKKPAESQQNSEISDNTQNNDAPNDEQNSDSETPEMDEFPNSKSYKSNPLLDKIIGRQYYLNNIGDIYSTWDKYRGDGVTIAVIDAGFNPNHEDFVFENGESKVLNTSGGFKVENGEVKFTKGLSAATDMYSPHGTFCAGVAAAGINSKGVVGIAPNASLLLLKTDCKPASINAAFNYARKQGVKVITISIGSYEDKDGDLSLSSSDDIKTVFAKSIKDCYNAGIVVCSAGGNGGESSKRNVPCYPAANDYVIGVGGISKNESATVWGGSTTHKASIDIYAPSEGMFGDCHNDNVIYQGGWKGTSFASPIVAGAAALYFQKFPNHTPKQFEDALYETAYKFKSSYTGSTILKRIDIGKLMGIECEKKNTITIRSRWTKASVFAWNLKEDKANANWPGVTLASSVNNEYTFELDPKEYESFIFVGGDNQSVNLSTSVFAKSNKLNMYSAICEFDNIYSGSYF